MYAAKREGGQCIRSFVPDLPFPYAFPQFTDSAISAPEAAEVDRPPTAPFGYPGSRARPALRRRWRGRSGRSPTSRRQHETNRSDAPDGIRWPPMPIRIAMAVLAIGVIAFTATSVLIANAGHSVFFAKFLYPALNLLAAGLIAVRAYRVTADRLAWSLIAAGMACSAMGDVVYALWVPDGQSPSAADPEYLAFYPFVYAGLLLLMRARLKRVPDSDPARFPGLRVGHGRGGRGADGRAHPRGRDPRTGNRAGGPGLSVGRSGPAGSGRRHAANLWLAQRVLAGFFSLPGLFCLRSRTRRISSRPPPAHTGLAPRSMPSGPLRRYWWRWPAGRRWSSAAPLPRRGLGSYAVPVACTVVALGVAVLGHNSRLASTLAALSLIAVAARFSVTFRDVSMLAESHKHAMTDELTALPNRRSLATALTAVSGSASAGPSSATRASSRRALLLLKLCEFQEINDSVGRHFGDELLCHIANRLVEQRAS